MEPIDINSMMQNAGGFSQEPRANLLSVLTDIAFGFIAGLMIFIGPKEVIEYGSKLAGDLVKLADFERQLGSSGFATSAAPYVLLAPLGGVIVRQLSSVRSFKTFTYFILAVGMGIALAYITREYFVALM
jgi:hypothetical protein